jgi:peptidoglycan-associated lipoprotein
MKRFMSAGLVALIGMFTLVGCANQNVTGSALKRVHFDFDKSYIRTDMVPIMDGNASYLKGNSTVKVTIEGHCDERGTNEYNMALGARRAESAKNYLVGKGVSPARLSTVSFGEEKPTASGHNESAWYMNRRAEFNK